MSILDAVIPKVVGYVVQRITEPTTVLAAILRLEASLHIDKIPDGFNQDLVNGLIWIFVAIVAALPQQWKPAGTFISPPAKS